MRASRATSTRAFSDATDGESPREPALLDDEHIDLPRRDVVHVARANVTSEGSEPRTRISSVAIIEPRGDRPGQLHVGLHGRGLIRIIGYEEAKLASLFIPGDAAAGSSVFSYDHVATLFGGDLVVIGNAKVTLRIRRIGQAGTREFRNLPTDFQGRINFPSLHSSGLGKGRYVVHVSFEGNDASAPAVGTFVVNFVPRLGDFPPAEQQ